MKTTCRDLYVGQRVVIIDLDDQHWTTGNAAEMDILRDILCRREVTVEEIGAKGDNWIAVQLDETDSRLTEKGYADRHLILSASDVTPAIPVIREQIHLADLL